MVEVDPPAVVELAICRTSGRKHQAALLDDAEKEDPVDQAQQLAVIGEVGQLARANRGAQLHAGRVRQEGPTQLFQRGIDAVSKVLANPAALFDPPLEVLFEPTVRRSGGGCRKARAMEEAIDQDELAVEVAVDQRVEVELQVGRPGDPGGVAEEPQLAAVGDDPPERVRAIQVLLHQRVRAPAGPLGPPIERLVVGDDVNRWRLGIFVGPVGDEVALPTDRDRSWLEGQLKAESLEQRSHPGLAGERRCASLGPGQPALKAIAKDADIRERRLYLVAEPTDRRPFAHDEVGRPLPVHRPRRDLVEQIGGK